MNTINLNEIIKSSHKSLQIKHHGQARMVLAYHSLGNGICFGGIRLSTSQQGKKIFKDALRLSEAMTYKLSLINSQYGGCKAVAVLPDTGKSIDFLHDVGTLIEEEQGRFISAIDFGFEPRDAKIIKEKTQYIFALKDSKFGPSGVTTAEGVIIGIKTSLQHLFKTSNIGRFSYAVQGLGSVGNVVANELIKLGGKVIVADVDRQKTQPFIHIATVVSSNRILYENVDVLVPCGPAYILNHKTIPKLNCRIIAGGANCQLDDELVDDQLLFDRRILVAPDFVINAGGVIQGIEELNNGNLSKALSKLGLISKNLHYIYNRSQELSEGTYAIAKELAIAKIKENIMIDH